MLKGKETISHLGSQHPSREAKSGNPRSGKSLKRSIIFKGFVFSARSQKTGAN
jgi:hypothetical protein